MLRHAAPLSLALCLVACAPPKMYNWGNYEQGLYKTYKDPTEAPALRDNIEEQVVFVQANGQKMAPGLYAELGTLYLEAGDKEKAKKYYTYELNTWPESSVLMTGLIESIDRQNPSNPKKKVAK